jgi:hypothetical protein
LLSIHHERPIVDRAVPVALSCFNIARRPKINRIEKYTQPRPTLANAERSCLNTSANYPADRHNPSKGLDHLPEKEKEIKESHSINFLFSPLEGEKLKYKTLAKRVRQTRRPPSNSDTATRDKVATVTRIFEHCPSVFAVAGQNIERTMTPQRSLDENMAGLGDGITS